MASATGSGISELDDHVLPLSHVRVKGGEDVGGTKTLAGAVVVKTVGQDFEDTNCRHAILIPGVVNEQYRSVALATTEMTRWTVT